MKSVKSRVDDHAMTPAVVFPADRPAPLWIARSLGRRGIPVYGVDADPEAIAMKSRYLIPRPLPGGDRSDENRLAALVVLGQELGEAVLYPVSDDAVYLTSSQREILSRNYKFVMPDHETLRSVLTKDGIHRVAERVDIPTPRVYPASSLEQVEAVADQLSYPVILKPVFSPSWLRDEIIAILRESFLTGPSKVSFCSNAAMLIAKYKAIAVYDPGMVIEEVIPGEDSNLKYFCFYLDRQSQPLATFAGVKERILPVGFGSATYVRSLYDPQLEDISLQLLSRIHYQGLGGVEFKKDPRDGQYKLIEFNARFGMWDSLGAHCGVDIAYIAYLDALGRPVEAQNRYKEGVRWVDFQRDVRAFLIYNQRKQLSFGKWLKSLFYEKDWAFYTPDDWKPAWASYKILIERQLKRPKG